MRDQKPFGEDLPVLPGALGPVVPSLEFRCVQARTGSASPDLNKNNNNNPKISFQFSQDHPQFQGSIVHRAAEGLQVPARRGVSPPIPAPLMWVRAVEGNISSSGGSRGMSVNWGDAG